MNRYQVTFKSQKTGKEGTETILAKNEADLNTQIQQRLDGLAKVNVTKTVSSIVDFGQVVAGYDRFDIAAKGNKELAESMRREERYQ